jgi:hypothetical protein
VRLAGLLALPNLASPSRPVTAVSGSETNSIRDYSCGSASDLSRLTDGETGFHEIPFSSRLAASGTGHQLQNIEKNELIIMKIQ